MEVLPSPGLLPTAQEAGNMVNANDLAMTAPGSQPGYDGGAFAGPWPANTDTPPPSGPPEIPVGNPPPKPQPTSTWRPSGDWLNI
jgi:hypothetical protein